MPSDVEIRELRLSDAPALADAYHRNREHLAPWDPVRSPSFYTAEGQAEIVRGQLAEAARDKFRGWVLTQESLVLGRVNLNNIVLGSFCSGVLGYWVDVDHVGKGLATTAVGFACEEALHTGLHRVEASALVHNVASQAVLARSGFELYGLAPEYLNIAGRWQDCRLFQRILHHHTR